VMLPVTLPPNSENGPSDGAIWAVLRLHTDARFGSRSVSYRS
jgi:hypothetical protein